MIRPYETEDIEELLDVWYQASKIAHPFLSEEFLDKERNQIKYIYIDDTETFIYTDYDQLLGFISMVDNDVGALFVKPNKQRLGIGKQLLNFVLQKRDFLTVDVFKENEIGVNFYYKHGFKYIKEKLHIETGNLLIEMKLVKKAN
jgi:putative acetyltransferase